jgi:hypothetical protein
MNAHTPHITGGTLSDLVDFAIEENRWPHLQWTAKTLYSMELTDTLADAKSLLQRWDRRETVKRDIRHWSYDSNRAITTRQFLKLIEDYEAVRSAGVVAEFAYDTEYNATKGTF